MSAELAGDWLSVGEPVAMNSYSGALTGGVGCGTTGGMQIYPYVSPYNGYGSVTFYEPAKPIKLTLSEVDRLRKAAKADTALKAILQKFTRQIEIIVEI